MNNTAELRIAMLTSSNLDKWTKKELKNELTVLLRDYIECQKALKNLVQENKKLESLISSILERR